MALVLFSYPILIGVLLGFLWFRSDFSKVVKENYKSIIIFVIANFVLVNAFIYIRVRLENFIPYWDFAGFWKITLQCIDRFNDMSFIEFISWVYNSILHNEYNFLAETFLILPMKILGEYYSRYILSITNFFIIPANIILFIFTRKLFNNKSLMFNITIGGIITFFFPIIMPSIYGYIGSSGIVIISVILYMSYYEFSKDEISTGNNIFIGLLLLLTVLIRRWFAYFVVGYFASILFVFIIPLLIKKDKRCKTVFIKTFLQGIVALVLLVVFFRDLLLTFVSVDYGYAFAAYNNRTGLEKFFAFINIYGILYIVFAVLALFSKSRDKRVFGLLLWVMVITELIMFNMVQDFGTHHYFIINVQMMLLVILGVDVVISLLMSNYQLLIQIPVIVISILNLLTSSTLIGNIPVLGYLLTNVKYEVRETPEKEVIQELASFLRSSPEVYEFVYILSASNELNDDLVRNALLPEMFDAVPNAETTHVLDKRDGIPQEFFNYSYIVVADPAQYNARPEEQRVIGVLAEAMLNDEELKEYYTEVYNTEYLDMTIYVFYRIEDIKEEVREKYREIFKEYYPNSPELYNFD